MSELSRLFVQQKYHVKREVVVGPQSISLCVTKNDDSVMVDFTEGKSLLLSVNDSKGWKNRLAAARKICEQFMGAGPICRYDAKPSIAWTHFMEWNIVCPEERLSVVVNHGGEFRSIPIRNLQLLGDYCISDFKNTELSRIYAEAAEARQKYPGVYGKDPGGCDVVRVARADEFGLFLEYTLLVNDYYTLKQYWGADGVDLNLASVLVRQVTLDEMQEREIVLAIDYVVATICERLGFKITKEPSVLHRLEYDEAAFDEWLNHYTNHLLNLCPDDEARGKVFKDYQAGKDVSTYAPTAQ